MGMGKTVIVLTALADLLYEFEVGKVLVIAPLRVAKTTWPEEVKKWEHLRHLRLSSITGPRAKRERSMTADADIYLINRENVGWLVGNISKKAPWIWDTVVIDESSSFKNNQTIRYKALNKFIDKTDRLIEMTGTPAPNGLFDLWAQMKLIDGGKRLGKYKRSFRDRWMTQVRKGTNIYTWELRKFAEPQIHDRVKDVVLTLQADEYLELPEILYNRIPITLKDEVFEKYKHLAKEYCLELKEDTVTAANAGVLRIKLMQAANGAIYVEHPEYEILHDEKLNALLEILDVIPGPAIVVYGFTCDKERIMEALSSRKISNRLLSKPQDEKDWNAGKIHRLLLHPASAGHGLNIYQNGVSDLIWYGPTHNLEHYLQANARITGGLRAKGKQPRIHHLIASGTVDEIVETGSISKQGFQNRLLDATAAYVRQIVKQDS